MKFTARTMFHGSLFAGALLMSASAQATLFTFSNEFSASGSTCTGSCATLEVLQNGANLDFKLTASLDPGEFIAGLYGNIDPFVDLIAEGSLANIGDSDVSSWIFSMSENAFKADGDGFFDWVWDFPTSSSADQLTNSDMFSWTFLNTDADEVLSALSDPGDGSNSGPFTFALRVRGLGTDNEGSGWFSPTRDDNGNDIPAPATLVLLGLALLGMGMVRRGRR